MSEQKAMKLGLGADAIGRISVVLAKIITDFPEQAFNEEAQNGLEELELKQRVDHLIIVLANYLPTDFQQTAKILLQIKLHWDWGDENDALRTFAAWPLIDYVAKYGLKHPEISLQVLKNITSLFSAEFAIRTFIEHHFELTYQTALRWCKDEDEHVRRLASEGFRPRLPWGKPLTIFCDNPEAPLKILELLKDDDSLYVRKSVANNLNEISKDNPEDIISVCQKWIVEASTERKWIIHHGLRGLIKKGDKNVFPLLGYTARPQVEIVQFGLFTTRVQIGESITFSLDLDSAAFQVQKFVVDYRVHHVKANGAVTAKVFKWKNITLEAKQRLSMRKIHPFKLITTRRYYPGEHAIELLINGKSYGQCIFNLIE